MSATSAPTAPTLFPSLASLDGIVRTAVALRHALEGAYGLLGPGEVATLNMHLAQVADRLDGLAELAAEAADPGREG